MADSANVDQVMAFLDDFLHSIQFTRPGIEGSMGKDAAMTIIRGPHATMQGGIMGRCAQEVTPEGRPWPHNSAEYAADKERRYGWSETNRRTNQMLSQESLYGRTRIEPEAVTLVYGTGSPPSSSGAPTGYMSKGDAKTPDTIKAALAHSSNRDFYRANDDDAKNVTAVLQETVNQMIRSCNGG